VKQDKEAEPANAGYGFAAPDLPRSTRNGNEMMRLRYLLVIAVIAVVGCISAGRNRPAEQIVGTWVQDRVEGPRVHDFTNEVRFAERTFANDGTYETRAGRSASTAFVSSGRYTYASSRLETVSSAGDRFSIRADIVKGMLVLTDGTNTCWMRRLER
jgi:hypothetical protein